MPTFSPFVGLRYDESTVRLADVVAPPYDIVDPDQRQTLVERSPFNCIEIELPVAHANGADPYAAAAETLARWIHDGVLSFDDEPAFYVYRMGYHDEFGRPQQTAGVIGALTVEQPGSGDLLPHERTIPKAKSDRLDLIRATRLNTSPIWGLSLAQGWSGLCELPGPPVARVTDADGVHHRLWRVTEPGVVTAIAAAVGSAPIVIADGHHRFETANTYLAERGDGDQGATALMAFVVELSADQLDIRPIHRLVAPGSDLTAGAALAALRDWYDVTEVIGDNPVAADALPELAVDRGAVVAIDRDGTTWLLSPRPQLLDAVRAEATDGEVVDTDAAHVAVALRHCELGVAYHHDAARVAAAVARDEAALGLILRPVTIAQIDQAARARSRMPQKSTYFYPKPATGLVFRSLDH